MDTETINTLKEKRYISKGDFKTAQSCLTKLYYKKLGFPTTLMEDDYMKLLAECGFVVGKIAHILHPGGVEIANGGNLAASVRQTNELLKQDRITLFEPAIYHENKLVLIDVLVKDGDRVDLIEVKSKGFGSLKSPDGTLISDSRQFYTNNGDLNAEWRPYVEDAAYQTYVLREAYPHFKVRSFLFMPDKAKRTKIDGLPNQFQLIRKKSENSSREELNVEFSGDAEAIRHDSFMTLVEVTEECSDLADEIAEQTSQMLPYINPAIRRFPPVQSKACANCEYHANNADERDGFYECWNIRLDKDSSEKTHLFDLYYGGTIKGKNGLLYDELIQQGKESIFDVPLTILKGKRGIRQRIQIENTRTGTEWFSEDLSHTLNNLDYPLHFVDFETSRIAIPSHKGMRPFEQIAFQWSVHTIPKKSAAPVHAEWINTDDSFPNFEFARTLMSQIGDGGSVLTWAAHENTTLRDIHSQMSDFNIRDKRLQSWLEGIIKFDKDDASRIVDLNRLCADHYFHPFMGGRTSLKVVLPAIWNHQPYLHDIPYFRTYYAQKNGRVQNPYETLKKIKIYEEAEAITEGGGAMMAYQEMMFGSSKNDPTIREAWKKLLLQYCELDTMAMVIVWTHWMRRGK